MRTTPIGWIKRKWHVAHTLIAEQRELTGRQAFLVLIVMYAVAGVTWWARPDKQGQFLTTLLFVWPLAALGWLYERVATFIPASRHGWLVWFAILGMVVLLHGQVQLLRAIDDLKRQRRDDH